MSKKPISKISSNRKSNDSFNDLSFTADQSALNLSYAGEVKKDKVLKAKYSYKKDGTLYKSTFVPYQHMFPEDSKKIRSKDFHIIVSPYFNAVELFDDYVNKVSPSIHIEQKGIIRSRIGSNNYSSMMFSNLNTDFKKQSSNMTIPDTIHLTKRKTEECPSNTSLMRLANRNDSSIMIEIPEEEVSSAFCTTISPEDFEILEVVGIGHFGKVSKVRYRGDGEIYALKSCKKSKLKENKQKEHALNERKILGNVNHPFIVSLKYAFQSETKLYMVMEYLNGGELFYHMRKTHFFSESTAKFFLAQIVCALDFLHENKIIYRDLKPENLVLDNKGYIKLTDFGLSKENIGENQFTKTFCGTCEYLSPEMIKGDPYNQSVDMWSLGILYFEMLVGVPPFFDKNRDKLYKKIYFNDPNYALNKKVVVSDVSINFINRLLCKNPLERMTIRDAKKHELFKGFNFEKLMAYELQSPLKLNVNVSVYYI